MNIIKNREVSFWKLSESPQLFEYRDFMQSIEYRRVYLRKDTGPKGNSGVAQAERFITANVGDYFYLTYGNEGIYLLGQFVGPANGFSGKGKDWLERSFQLTKWSTQQDCYDGPEKWWAPNHTSTFIKVPDTEVKLFSEHILRPYFGIDLEDYSSGSWDCKVGDAITS